MKKSFKEYCYNKGIYNIFVYDNIYDFDNTEVVKAFKEYQLLIRCY